MSGDNPCYQCNKRTYDCHGKCKLYLKWYKINKNKRHEVFIRKTNERLADDDIIERRIKHKKKKQRI